MATADPHSPARQVSAGRVESGLAACPDPLDDAARLLRPASTVTDPAALLRHMDRCVALAVKAGLCRGRALATHASVQEACGEDLVRADRQLANSLRALLGLSPLTGQEH